MAFDIGRWESEYMQRHVSGPVNRVGADAVMFTPGQRVTIEGMDAFNVPYAAERAALDNLKAGVAAMAQRVSDLAAQLAATATGSGPTEAQLAEMAADAKEIQGAADALKAAAAPAAEA